MRTAIINDDDCRTPDSCTNRSTQAQPGWHPCLWSVKGRCPGLFIRGRRPDVVPFENSPDLGVVSILPDVVIFQAAVVGDVDRPDGERVFLNLALDAAVAPVATAPRASRPESSSVPHEREQGET